MPASVVSEGEVSLGGVYYPLLRPVRRTLASTYPAKVVIGDTSRDDQQRASVLAFSDWRGGIGIERMEGATDVDRCWWSTCNLRHRNHLVLGKLVTQTADLGTPNTSTIGAIASYGDEVYAAFGTAVHKYDNSSDSWGSSLHTLPAAATDAITLKVGGTNYLVFAHTGGYSYWNDSAWVDDTDDAKYLTAWDDKLYFVDNTGQLGHTTASTMGTDTITPAEDVPVETGSVTDLLVYGDASDAPIIYALTKDGMFAHDSSNTKFIRTNADLAIHPSLGTGSLHWRGSLFVPAGQSIYRYTSGQNSVTSLVGPDRDDGIASRCQCQIVRLQGSHNALMAAMAPIDTTVQDTFSSFGGTPPNVGIIPSATPARAVILSWNEVGWQVEWEANRYNIAIDTAHVSRAYSGYRLWWAWNKRVYYIDLPQNIVNPNQLRGTNYASASEHTTPWFDAGQVEVDKLALEVRLDCAGMSKTEKVEVAYGLDYDDSSFTTLGTITTNGVTTFKLPDSTTPKGIAFRSWRFKLVLSRGANTAVTPDVISLVLIWRKKLPPKEGFTLDIDLSRPSYKGNTPAQLRSALRTANASQTLLECTYRDDADQARNYWVDVASVSGLDFTGHDERGSSTVLVVEP